MDVWYAYVILNQYIPIKYWTYLLVTNWFHIKYTHCFLKWFFKSITRLVVIFILQYRTCPNTCTSIRILHSLPPPSYLLSCLMKRYRLPTFEISNEKKVEIMKLKNVLSEIISFVFFSVIRCFRYFCTKCSRCFYKFTTVAKINYCATSKNSCLQNICSIGGLEDRYMYWDQKEAICFASVSTS